MGWIYSKWKYKSRKWPEYVVGNEVYVTREIPKPWLGTGVSPNPPKYIIKEVSPTARGGIINKEFVYVIKNIETNMVTLEVYESELQSAAIPFGHYKPDSIHTDYEQLILAITKNLNYNEKPSLYNDNILELTWDNRTETYSLWFDNTITDPEIIRKITLLFRALSVNGCSVDETVRAQHKYIDPTIKVGSKQLDEKNAWTAKSLYTLLARRYIWEDLVYDDEEFQKSHPSAPKIQRPDEKYIK